MTMKPITVTLEHDGLKETVVVDTHVFSHIMCAHSLDLHDWMKKAVKKAKDGISEFNKREKTAEVVAQFHDVVDDINNRRKQADSLEQAFKNITVYRPPK